MSRILVVAIGSAGDVFPLIGIARVLQQRGHRVVFATHAPFELLVRRQGFEFLAIGSAEHYEAGMRDPALWNPRTSLRTLWGLIAPTLPELFHDLRRAVDQDTVIVGTLWAWSARMVQECDQVPFVSVQISPSTLLSAHAPPTHKRIGLPRWLPLPLRRLLIHGIDRLLLDRLFGPATNDLRRQLNLPPVKRIFTRWMHSPDGVLCLFPAWFAAPQPDWPAQAFLSGFPMFSEGSALDSDLLAYLAEGPPPVIFTAGSTLADDAHFFACIRHALALTGQRGIWLTPDPACARYAGSHLAVRSFVPLDALLPHCRILVHHGGVGTAALAYAAGVPQLVTPFAHDQFDNAQRVAQSGCGVRLDAPLAQDTLARALQRMLADPSYRVQSARYRDRLLAEPPGGAAAADFIEQVLRRRILQGRAGVKDFATAGQNPAAQISGGAV